MKIAYVLPINVEKFRGVLIKVDSQVEEWLKQGEDVKVFLISDGKGVKAISTSPLSTLNSKGRISLYTANSISFIQISLINDFIGLNSVYTNVEKDLDSFSPDIIYARSSLYHPFYKRIGLKYRMILEINTDLKSEYKLQSLDSFKYFFRYIYFLITNKYLFKNVSGVAAVTYDISEKINVKNKKVFPNSINVDNYTTLKKFKTSTNKKSILFIGTSKLPWHGIDVLLELAIKLPEIDFNIIGSEGDEFEQVPKNVQFHGFLTKDKYLPIFEKSTAAIGSLAFYRNNMKEACPLKVREYVACCKPIILPYDDTTFEQKGYPDWALRIPNNKDGILNNSDRIKEFLNNCDQFDIKIEDVRKFVDVSVIEKERLAFFYETFDL